MKAIGLTEPQLVDLISGRINGSLQRIQDRMDPESLPTVLPELCLELAKAMAAAIHSNNLICAEQSLRSGNPATPEHYYDHLSQCIDGY